MPSLKRSAAVALLGEERAMELVDRGTVVRNDAAAWRKRTLTAAGRSEWQRIRQFKNIHAGKRCVIIGNGPSLRDTDMELLRNEYTFGLNRIYLMFDKLGWKTTYHVAVNYLIAEQCHEDLRKIEVPFFTSAENHKYFGGMPNAVYMNIRHDGLHKHPQFSHDISLGYWECGTVTYATLQLAYYMGFSEVILVGVDHRFSITGPPGKVIEAAGPDNNHFDPAYFAKGFRWQLPALELTEAAYGLARVEFEKKGRRIVDSTVGGALTVFPRMPLDQALGKTGT